MGSCLSRVDTKTNMTGVQRWGHTEGTAMGRTGAEVEKMPVQAKGLLGLPEALRGKDGPSPGSGDIIVRLISWFWILASRTLHRVNFCCLQPLKYAVICYCGPRKPGHMVSELEELLHSLLNIRLWLQGNILDT